MVGSQATFKVSRLTCSDIMRTRFFGKRYLCAKAS